MLTTCDPNLLLSTLFAALLIAGCDDGDLPGPDEAAASERVDSAEADQETMVLELALPGDTAHATIEAISRSAEALAGEDVRGAKVMAKKKRDEGPFVLKIELWGPSLDDESVVLERLRERHALLRATPVSLDRVAGAPAGEAPLDLQFAEDATPAEIEAQVREQLAATGAEGEVQVEVGEDADGHRRVNVRLESSKTEIP